MEVPKGVLSMSSEGNVRHDWYQTESHVVISIMLKQMNPESFRVDLTENSVTCISKLPDDQECCLHIPLAHEISTTHCVPKFLPSKVEIKLKKANSLRWESLKAEKIESKDLVCSYPSSNKEKRDWDKLAVQIKKEEEDEKLEGDAALNQMFQKVYSQGTDETRRAMNKSFIESGGTVLSTNWKEVNQKTVDIKPPDGMEWKKWDS